MPGIVIQANFDLMQEVPLDSRLVATNSLDRDAIQYKYAGMKVYQKDINRTWTWNGTGWDAEGSGIYGGSGSLIGDTFINMGSVSTAFGSQSNYLVYRTDTTAATEAYIYNGFIRHTSAIPSALGTEFIQQYKYFDGANLYNASHISYNPKLGGSDVVRGGLSFHTGNSNNVFERMRITGGGNVGIGTNDPKELLQIATTSSPQSSPLVFHNSGSAVIGHNWYFSSSTDQYFDVTKASTKIIQSSGSFIVQNRPANTAADGYVNTLFTIGTNAGRVGIRNVNPTTALDVTGEILGLTVSSANRVQARSYNFSALVNGLTPPAPTSIYTVAQSSGSALVVRAGGTSSFVSDGNFNYFTPKSNFLDEVSISKDLYVVENTTIDGNLTVTGTSSITNFEPSISLVPSDVWRSNGVGQFNQTSGMTVSLSSFTYSFDFYRVGALTYLTLYVETISPISHISSGLFYGFLFRFSNQRFGCINPAFGVGTAYNITQGKDFFPISLEVFQTDPTPGLDPSTGLPSSVTPITGNDFYVRIRPTRSLDTPTNLSNFFISSNNVLVGNKFRGTVVYLSGDITSSSPTPPPLIAPGGLGGGPSA